MKVQCPRCENSFMDGDSSADEEYLACKLLHDPDNLDKQFLEGVLDYYYGNDDTRINNPCPRFKEG